ncbi:MAG: hypothetical protein EBR27_02465 [Betaproteobacteria bacterium]|nr:hypothetical protein [Betaproteobacteria bacterium]NBY71822.1 hypothetical protein [Betaproteobacteria bacterium]
MATQDNSGFDPTGFAKFVPGFDFLQSLSKGASASMPQGMQSAFNQWVAPTMDPEVIEKRLEELRTVLFWLEQNTTALKATIQALEVQKMTLSALRTMNVDTPDWSAMFKAKAETHAQPQTQAEPEPAPQPQAKPEAAKAEQAKPAADPMQMWGALTQQFQNIATQALQDVASKAAPFQTPFQTGSQPPATANKTASNFAKPAKSKSGAAKTPPASKATSAARKGFTPAKRPRG